MLHQFLRKKLFALGTILFIAGIIRAETTIQVKDLDKNNQEITLKINLEKDDLIYKDYIEITVDHPDITLSDWIASKKATNFFSKEFSDTKKVYKKDITITLQASKSSDSDISDANIHLSYYLHSKNGLVEEVMPLKNDTRCNCKCCCCSCQECVQTHIDASGKKVEEKKNTQNTNQKEKKKTWTAYISDLVKSSKSIWLQILLAILLGVLLSLTPCIYPMIPITVGILQSQGSKSILQNFLLAFTYVAGISTTFAVLGLIAAFTGQLLGSILVNPIFVSILVVVLIYFALSLFGFYEIYTPKFMKSVGGGAPGKGGILSIFVFGLASGTIASPCVSPGLVLLLSIVTAIGSKLLGFLLLFAFGMGLGAPLLIIGTFSGSINMMPKAGSWMIEIKKIFGIMMLFVCFYFLNNILPWYILLWLVALLMLTVGIYYLLSIKESDTQFWKIFKSILGIAFCASSILFVTKAFKETSTASIKQVDTFWQKDFEKALILAKKENKLILLDFWAQFCSVCKAIDKKIFKNTSVRKTLTANFVSVKIDGTNPQEKQYAQLSKAYNLVGVPAYIIIDPRTKKLLKKWTAELYDTTPKEFIKEIKSIK